MTSHKWKKDSDGTESCERVGCTVRQRLRGHEGGIHEWQRTKKGHWHPVSFIKPIPPCAGKEAGEVKEDLPPLTPEQIEQRAEYARKVLEKRKAPAPSSLEVVRMTLAYAPDGMQATALTALATLEESIRKDEREKCAREVDTVATGYGSLQRQALAAAARELRNRK